MDIAIPAEGFDGRGLLLRTNFWFGPKVYLDDKPLKKNKTSVWTQKATFIGRDNSGKLIEIRFQGSVLDPVPAVEVSGRVYHLVQPFTWYQIGWIGFPLLLVFLGGLIGIVLGTAATLVNARLFRSSQGTLRKYLQSGIISVLAVAVTFALIPRAVNLVEWIKLKYAYESESNGAAAGSNRRGLISSKAWKFQGLFSQQGVDLTTDSNPLTGSRTYFRADGQMSRVFSDGSFLTGNWRLSGDERSIIVTLNEEDYSAEIVDLNTDSLIIEFNHDGILVVYIE